MTFMELRAAIVALLNQSMNLSAEEVYGVIASVEAEVRMTYLTSLKKQIEAAEVKP